MTDTDRRTANFEALYRWVISDPRPYQPEVSEDVGRLYALAGFTWEDVDAIRAVANGWTMDAENHDVLPGLTAHERAIRDRALSAADRLAALLPPR